MPIAAAVLMSPSVLLSVLLCRLLLRSASKKKLGAFTAVDSCLTRGSSPRQNQSLTQNQSEATLRIHCVARVAAARADGDLQLERCDCRPAGLLRSCEGVAAREPRVVGGRGEKGGRRDGGLPWG